jgi:hypothetical protein
MNKIVFFIILLSTIVFNNAKCIDGNGFISYIFSTENVDGDKRVNHSLGFEIVINDNNYYFHNFGIFIKDINNTPALNLKYNFYLINSRHAEENIFNFGPGININIGKYTGIAPEVNIIFDAFLLKFNLFYRYNLYVKHNNTHEFGCTFSVIEAISTLIMRTRDY